MPREVGGCVRACRALKSLWALIGTSLVQHRRPIRPPTGQDIERKNDKNLRQELDSSWTLAQRHSLPNGELVV